MAHSRNTGRVWGAGEEEGEGEGVGNNYLAAFYLIFRSLPYEFIIDLSVKRRNIRYLTHKQPR